MEFGENNEHNLKYLLWRFDSSISESEHLGFKDLPFSFLQNEKGQSFFNQSQTSLISKEEAHATW